MGMEHVSVQLALRTDDVIISRHLLVQGGDSVCELTKRKILESLAW